MVKMLESVQKPDISQEMKVALFFGSQYIRALPNDAVDCPYSVPLLKINPAARARGSLQYAYAHLVVPHQQRPGSGQR